jgi:hypothetical protein
VTVAWRLILSETAPHESETASNLSQSQIWKPIDAAMLVISAFPAVGCARSCWTFENLGSSFAVRLKRLLPPCGPKRSRAFDVTGLMPDQIHFNADGYRQWIPAITGMICSRVAEAK